MDFGKGKNVARSPIFNGHTMPIGSLKFGLSSGHLQTMSGF